MVEESKPKRGRPVKDTEPEPIPDTAENVIKSLLRTRPKAEREMLNQRAKDAASS